MNKSSFNRYKNIMFSVMLLIIFAIVSFKIVNNVEYIFGWIVNFIDTIWKMIIPFVIGAFIAFILSSAVKFLETDFANVFAKGRVTKTIRIISVFTVYLIAISLISLTIVYLVPAIQASMTEFKNNLPSNFEKAEEMISKAGITIDIDVEREITNFLTNAFSEKGTIFTILDNIANLTSSLLNAILGVIIAFYMLVDRENIGRYVKKAFIAMTSKEKTEKIIEFAQYVSKTFDKFIIGKVIDSIIIGLMCYIGLLIFGIKYRLIFSIIIGVTNVIPYFGPFMGAIPVIILVFLYDPAMTIPIALLIFVLQQFDGSILGPMVLGDAIGVKPLAVIFSILIGGALFGVLGMFLAVPTYVVITELINKYIDINYQKNIELKEGK